MRAWLGLLLATFGVAFTGCSGSSGNGDGGLDAGYDGSIPFTEPVIAVSGRVVIHPSAAAWLADSGQPVPSVDGLAASVNEPYRAQLLDPDASFGEVGVDASGSFVIPKVQTALVVYGLSGGVRDPGARVFDGGLFADGGCCAQSFSGRVIATQTAIFDVRLSGAKPTLDIASAVATALPLAFHDRLTSALTPARILALTGGQASTLRESGFVLGRIVDGSGNPLSGLSLTATAASWQSQLFYFSDDLGSVTQTSTGKNGLFVFVNDGSAQGTLGFVVANHAEYLTRNLTTARGFNQVITVFPGSPP